MYQLVYYITKTNLTSLKQECNKLGSEVQGFRLRKNALHYLLEIVRPDYHTLGYATEVRVGGIYCYKSKRTENGEREIEEVLIKVEKA